jgi:RNA polymerase primary sigma factor
VWWIRQAILQALAEQSRIIRLPLNKVGSLNKINKAFSDLEQKYEREPTPDELACLLNVEIDEVRSTLGVAGRHVSMDAPFVNGEENSLLDVIENPNSEQADKQVSYCESLSFEVERSLAALPPKQAQVLKLYFGIGVEQPLSLEDIGSRYDLTRERVRQIKDKALMRLKSTDKCKLLKSYLGA